MTDIKVYLNTARHLMVQSDKEYGTRSLTDNKGSSSLY